jgi:hypothetical protein
MSDKLSPPRFMVRKGTRGFMVWDRDRKGPATFNGYPATDLTEEQANEIKTQLSEIFGA